MDSMNNKGYKVSLTKRYPVVFAKDGVRFKKGDKTEVSMMVAAKLARDGRITPTKELLEDAKALGSEGLFPKK